MSLRTYERALLDPIILTRGCGDPSCDALEPGSQVTHREWGGTGIVISITPDAITVLWAQEPVDDWHNFTLPNVRRVTTPLLAKQVLAVQPMSLPAGQIFYFDYAYGQQLSRVDRVKAWLRARIPGALVVLLTTIIGTWWPKSLGRRP